MIIGHLHQIRELKVVDAKAKFLRDELPYKRANDPETLPRAGCADQHGTPETVLYVNPTAMDLFAVIKPARNVDRIRRHLSMQVLHKGFPLQVPFVFPQI